MAAPEVRQRLRALLCKPGGNPPQTPRLLDSPTENVVLTAGRGSGHLSQEGLCLQGESFSHLDTTNRARACPDEFWVRGFLASSGSRHSGSVLNCCYVLWVGRPSSKHKRGWYQRPVGHHQTSLLPSPAATAGSTKSRSRIEHVALSLDLHPSRQVRPATLSKAHPLFPSPPALKRTALLH